MKYTSAQKQLLGDYTLRRRELREDELYMEAEVTQSKVDKIKLKIALSKEQDNCEAINYANANAAETLSVMHENSMLNGTYGDLNSIEMSNILTARLSALGSNSIDNKKIAEA